MENIHDNFINFRVFSHFSNFESIIKIEDLVKFAKNNNNLACVLCDRMNLFGAADFSNYCSKYKIKPIIGCLLNITDIGYLPVYIYNNIGYKNLSFMLSQLYMNNNTSIDLLELCEYKEGLIVFSGDESIFSNYNVYTHDKSIEYLLKLQQEFKENFFIELNMATTNNLNYIINLSEDNNIPIVVTSTTRFLEPKDAVALQIFKLIETGGFYDSEVDFEWKNMYYNTKNIFDNKLKIGILNGIKIAQKCCFMIENQQPILPLYDLSNQIDVAQELYNQTIAGLTRKLGTITQEYYDRVNLELKVLISKNFCNYFLVTADFVKYAKDNNISVGPGRGSGVGCLVAYGLDITALDPIEHNLLFERFLNPERASLPDFDIDFEPEQRHLIIDYVTRKYGKYGVMQIITYMVLQARAVMRDVGRVARLSFRELNNLTSLIPQDQINPVKLKEALEIVPELKNLYQSNSKYKFVFDIALRLEGMVRNFSKHAAGIVISHIPIYERCPLYRDSKGDLVTQFDLKYLEYVGLIKFDFLGLKTLTILHDAVKLIEKNHNKLVDIDNISLEDPNIFKMLNNDKKLPLEGIFQFEGKALNDSMIKLKATSFNDLVALNALYRPGPIDNIPHYIKRKHGQEEIVYLHKQLSAEITAKLDFILKPTYGILVYQEQIMQAVCVLANFSLAEADLLRRAMGKKKKDEMLALKETFCTRCLDNNISRDISEDIFNTIEKFAGYAFNKSHAVAYAFIAYQCLYLKCYFLHEFTESYLKAESGNIAQITKYLYEMRERGYIVMKPNIQKSQPYCTIQDKNIYLGLKEISNMNINIAVNVANHAPYKNIYEFTEINKSFINKKNWDAMIYSGLLDDLDIHSSLNIYIESIYHKRALLFHNMNFILSKQSINTNIPKIILENEITMNENALTITPEPNSLIFRNLLSNLNINNINECSNNGEYKVCAVILSMKRKRKGNSLYAFVEIGDHTAMIDFVLFNEDLVKYTDKYSKSFNDGGQFIFHISVFKSRVSIKNIYNINDYLLLYNNIDINVSNIDDMYKLCNKLLKLNGNTRINIVYKGTRIETQFYIQPTLNLLYELEYQL